VAELKQIVELDQLVHSPELEADQAMLARVQEEIGQREEEPKAGPTRPGR
jgi:hypothetical protein